MAWTDPRIRAGGTRRLRSTAALTGILMVFGGVLAGCASPGSESVTIRFVQNKREVIDYFDTLITQFEAENPNINVIQDNNEGGFVPSLVRDSPPDVTTRGWNYASGDFARKDVFEDLSDLNVAAQIDPAAQELISEWGEPTDGGTPALPYSLTAAGVIYNKEIFQEVGVEVPTTWEEFVAACEEFEAAGVTPIYGTYKEPWTVAQGMFDYTAGGLLDVSGFFAQLQEEGGDYSANSDVTFSNTFDVMTDPMNFIMEHSQEGAASRGYPDGNVAFANGEAAMYLQGPWALSEIEKANPDVSVGSFPLAMSDDPEDTRVRVNVDLALSIPVGAEHPEEARQFVEWLFQPEIINGYNSDNAAFSTLKDAPPQDDERIEGLNEYVTTGRYYQGASTYPPPSIPVPNYLQSYVLGGTADALYSTLDAEWRRVAERNAARGAE